MEHSKLKNKSNVNSEYFYGFKHTAMFSWFMRIRILKSLKEKLKEKHSLLMTKIEIIVKIIVIVGLAINVRYLYYQLFGEAVINTAYGYGVFVCCKQYYDDCKKKEKWLKEREDQVIKREDQVIKREQQIKNESDKLITNKASFADEASTILRERRIANEEKMEMVRKDNKLAEIWKNIYKCSSLIEELLILANVPDELFFTKYKILVPIIALSHSSKLHKKVNEILIANRPLIIKIINNNEKSVTRCDKWAQATVERHTDIAYQHGIGAISFGICSMFNSNNKLVSVLITESFGMTNDLYYFINKKEFMKVVMRMYEKKNSSLDVEILNEYLKCKKKRSEIIYICTLALGDEIGRVLDILLRSPLNHGDLSLENACISEKTRKVKLIDWDIATTSNTNYQNNKELNNLKNFPSAKTNSCFTGGKPHMLPREALINNALFSHLEVDPSIVEKRLVWQLGIFIHLILTGKYPFWYDDQDDNKSEENTNLQSEENTKKLIDMIIKNDKKINGVQKPTWYGYNKRELFHSIEEWKLLRDVFTPFNERIGLSEMRDRFHEIRKKHMSEVAMTLDICRIDWDTLKRLSVIFPESKLDLNDLNGVNS